MEDEVILMSPPGATGSKRHRFCKVEHNGKSYWVDLTATVDYGALTAQGCTR